MGLIFSSGLLVAMTDYVSPGKEFHWLMSAFAGIAMCKIVSVFGWFGQILHLLLIWVGINLFVTVMMFLHYVIWVMTFSFVSFLSMIFYICGCYMTTINWKEGKLPKLKIRMEEEYVIHLNLGNWSRLQKNPFGLVWVLVSLCNFFCLFF